MWISHFNQQGIDGVTYRPKTGCPRSISPAKVTAEILPVVDDPSMAGETHWATTKLVGWLATEKQLDLAYSTLLRYLQEHGYKRNVPRPMPEPQSREKWEDQRDAFAGELLQLLEDESCDVFFGDESGFERDPRPRQK